MAVSVVEKAQQVLMEKLANLPREGVDRSLVEALPGQAVAEVRPKRKSGRTLVKEEKDRQTSRLSKLKPGDAVDRSYVEEL